MRFVLVDADQLMTSLVEAMLDDLGHEVVGVTGSPADAVEMIRAARPDGVIVDLALGYTSDFDVLEAAHRISATAIVFGHIADGDITGGFQPRPAVVARPDLSELERVVARLGQDLGTGRAEQDRRGRPSRRARGRAPTNPADAEAFYEALNEAIEGDALLAVGTTEGVSGAADGHSLATRIQEQVRDGDRVLASKRSVKVYLPGSGRDGIESLLRRLKTAGTLSDLDAHHAVVLEAGEAPGDAFDRLRRMES